MEGTVTEQLPVPELSPATPETEPPHERASERRERAIKERVTAAAPIPVSAPSRAAVPAAPKTALREDIEAALADEQLRQLFAALEPTLRQVFRAAANALADRIEVMIAQGDLNLSLAHTGIVDWLTIIPNLNQWFLVQEAKVKTDAVLALARRTSPHTGKQGI